MPEPQMGSLFDSPKFTQRHYPDFDCFEYHCHYCGVDELPGWRACSECGHQYRSPADLRREYRRMPWQTSTRNPLRWAWRCLWVRAARIYHCPLCGHDF